MEKRQEKELLRADCKESRCLGCRRITRLVRAWTATVECQRIKTGLLESGVGELDGLDDFVTMGLKGEALVEDGAEVEKFGDFDDGEGR